MVLGVPVAIETTCHEMSAAVLLQKTAFRHDDAGVRRHAMVGIFDSAVVSGSAKFRIFSNTVEFEQPVFKPRVDIKLAAPNLVRNRIPCDHRFCSRSARGSTHTDDVV